MIRIALIALLFFSACTRRNAGTHVASFDVRAIAEEIMIPKSIMAEVEEEVSKESKTIAPVYIFTPLQVQLSEVNEGVLKNPVMQFNFPKGGGKLDLKDVVTGNGSFYLSFPSEQFENMPPELMHLYYISNSPVEKIDGESFGLGCGRMLDIKKSFGKLQDSDFLKLNTTGKRYLRVVSGQYIFVFRKASQLYITQVSIFDSRYSDLLCAQKGT